MRKKMYVSKIRTVLGEIITVMNEIFQRCIAIHLEVID